MARLPLCKLLLLAPAISAVWTGAEIPVIAAETTATTAEKSHILKLLVVDTDTIAQSHRLASISALPMSDNDVVVPWLKANTDRLEPEYLFELGRRLIDTDPAAALEWWAVAHARVDYDSRRCADPRAADDRAPFIGSGVPVPVTQYMREHHEEARDRAVQRKDLFVASISPLWICVPDTEGRPMDGAPGRNAALKPESEWAQIEADLRDNMVWNNGSPIVPDETTAFGTIKLHRAARIWIGGGVEAIALSPDGRTLAAQSYIFGRLTAWDVDSGRKLFQADRQNSFGLFSLRFSGDGRHIICSPFLTQADRRGVDANHAAADFLDVSTWKIDGSLTGLEPEKGFQWNSAQRLAVSPTDKYIGIMFQNPRFAPAAIYDASSLQLVRTVSIPGHYIKALAFSPDDERVALGSISGDIRIYDLKLGTVLGSNRPHKSSVTALAFSPDGRRLVSLGSAAEDTVTILDGSTAALLRAQSGDYKGFHGVAWSPDGRFIATYSHDGALRLWTASLNKSDIVEEFPIFVTAPSPDVFFSADGKRLALGIGSVAVVWELSEQ